MCVCPVGILCVMCVLRGCCVDRMGALYALCALGMVWMVLILYLLNACAVCCDVLLCAHRVCMVHVLCDCGLICVLRHVVSHVSCIFPAGSVHISCMWLYAIVCPFCEHKVCSLALPVGISVCVPAPCRLCACIYVCALWVTVDTSRRQWLLSSNREQPLTHSLIRIMLTLLLPTKNICLFNQSLLNSLHLFSQWERMGLLSHVCTLGFYEVGPQALSILSQGDSSRDNPQPS